MSPSADVYDHLIVGAGVTGLAYAWRRVREGRRVLVLEARDPGEGARTTRAEAGYLWDVRSEAVLGEAPHLEALLDALSSAHPSALPSAPRLVEGEALGGPRRAMTSRLIPLPRAQPPRAASPRPAHAAETLAALVRRTLGARLLSSVVRPAAGALYGSSPDRLGGVETAAALAVAAARGRGRPAPRRARVRVLDAGIESLAEALRAALGDRVRGASEVGRVTVGEGVARAETASGSHEAREIALAVPASVQARLLHAMAPHHAEALASLPKASVVAVALGLPADVLDAVPPCPGFLVPARTARVRAVLLTSRIAPARAPAGRALVQVRMGGPGGTDLAALSDDVLRGIAEGDLGAALGTSARADLLGVERLRVPAPPPGQRSRLAALTGELLALRVRLLGAHVLGTGLDPKAACGVPVPRAVPPGVELA